jgi:hypothetical protein
VLRKGGRPPFQVEGMDTRAPGVVGRSVGACCCPLGSRPMPRAPLPPPSPPTYPHPAAAGAGDETLRFWNVFPGAKSQGSGADGGMGSMMRTLIR